MKKRWINRFLTAAFVAILCLSVTGAEESVFESVTEGEEDFFSEEAFFEEEPLMEEEFLEEEDLFETLTESSLESAEEIGDDLFEEIGVEETSVFADGESIHIDEQHFPDANFRRIVIGFDNDGDGYLSLAERNDVDEIGCNYEDISSLTGIEFFGKLQILSCSDNNLTSIDVSSCPELTRLNCSNNQLTSLNVGNCSELTFLNCINNQLTSLDVNNCLKLGEFFCGDNQLTTLDVNQNISLRWLSCRNNKLTNLDIRKCQFLEYAYNNGNHRGEDGTHAYDYEEYEGSRMRFFHLSYDYSVKIITTSGTDREYYSVLWDCNGGKTWWGAEIEPKYVKVIAGAQVYGDYERPELDGFEFVGWSTEKDGEVVLPKDGRYTVTEDIVLYAKWQDANPVAEIHTVTWNSGDGGAFSSFLQGVNDERTVLTQTYLHGNNIMLPSVADRSSMRALREEFDLESFEGKVFKGWSTDGTEAGIVRFNIIWNDETDEEVYDEPEYYYDYPVTADMSFTAIWEQGSVVSFDGNGGLFWNGETVVKWTFAKNEYWETSPYRPTRDNYAFAGWSWTVDGEKIDLIRYQPQFNTDTTVYALWVDGGYIFWDYNGGTDSSGDEFWKTDNYANGCEIWPVTPEKEGKELVGWSETKDGEIVMGPDDCGVVNGNRTFYAVWADAVLKPHVHSFGNWQTQTPATCTAAGVEIRSCSCGEIETRPIPAKGHTPVTDAAVAATTTNTGLTQGSHCSVCGTILVAQQIIPKLPSETSQQPNPSQATQPTHQQTTPTTEMTVTAKGLKNNKLTLKKGKSIKLKVTGATGKVTFKSSKKKVASVSKAGKVKALKKGKSTITVSAGGKTIKIKLTVK